MKIRGRRKSSNVEDVRGRGRGSGRSGGLGRRVLPGGLIGIVILIAVIVLGGDPAQIISLLLGGMDDSGRSVATQSSSANSPEDVAALEFVSVVLADTETAWSNVFSESNTQYEEPRLVLFTDVVGSACGRASSSTGPFYCSGDRKIYLDTGFFRELERLGAPGDFAQAYVIAHEVGHHVQNLTGVLQRVREQQQTLSESEANALQVRVELQADCFAGIWGNRAATRRDLLDEGDVEEGLQAAASIGDDRLQKNAGRRVQPESFTHGTSADRAAWFRRGMASGDFADCDTFQPSEPL